MTKRKNLMILGAGDVGTRLADMLLSRKSVESLILVDRADSEGRKKAYMLAACHRADIRFVPADCTNQEILESVLKKHQPDIIVQAASLLSPWRIIGKRHPLAEVLHKVGVGVQLPCHISILKCLMRTLHDMGSETPVVNVSFPDLNHFLLGKMGLPTPKAGLGNTGIIHLRTSVNLWNRLRKSEKHVNDLPVIRVLAQHSQVYDVMLSQQPVEERRVRVYIGEEGKRDDDIAYIGKSVESVDSSFNIITAASCIPVIEALVDPSIRAQVSVAGPQGLLGGYPVLIDEGEISLDLPQNLTLCAALEYNRSIIKMDGIEEVDSAGTVYYTEKARELMKNLNPGLVEPLPLDQLDKRAKELLEFISDL